MNSTKAEHDGYLKLSEQYETYQCWTESDQGAAETKILERGKCTLPHMYFFIKESRRWQSLPCTIFSLFLHSETRVVIACAVSGANFRANKGHCGPKVFEYSGVEALQTVEFKVSCLTNWCEAVLHGSTEMSLLCIPQDHDS